MLVNGREPQYKVNLMNKSISFEIECDLKFVISKPSISFWLQLAYLAPAGPELGTAQPQLVYSFDHIFP